MSFAKVMPTIEKTVLVMHTPAQMFQLVDEVQRYPEFLPWCAKGEVISRQGNELVASLYIDYLKIRQHFTTRNHNTPPNTINMVLVDGPFENFGGGWRFHPLGSEGCKIEFRLEYTFSSKLLEKVIGPVFSRIMGTLVDAFIQEADRLYGDD